MTRPSNLQLFAVAVLCWGTTWHAIVYQIAVSTPEFGVTVRFALAAALVLAIAAWRGERLRLGASTHARLAMQGVFMYSLSYLCVYHAEKHVPSGLVAVGYSASPLLAGAGAWALWRTPLSARFVTGGAAGIAGVAVIFWPELSHSGARPTALLGLLFTAAAVLLSAVGSLAASRNARHDVPFWSGMGWSMGYGAAMSAAVLLALQQPVPALGAWSWWLSLVYLALAGTVLAFGAFLTLQQRVGPGRAATIGVMTPVLALVVSTAFEGYRPDAFTVAGAALAVLGNALMLFSPAAARAEG